ncbi:MAG: hypothetical protein N2234_00665 [Planctomycetota bacterium]|nr:hypothetical protein [Planctomycetota bacterium]
MEKEGGGTGKKLRAAIILRRTGPLPLEQLAQLYSECRGVPYEEATHIVVRNGGILLRDATPEETVKFGNLLKTLGVAFTLMPAENLPELKSIQTLSRIRVEQTQIEGETLEGGRIQIKSDNLLLASVGVLMSEDSSVPRYVLTVYAMEPFAGYRISADIASVENLSDRARMLLAAVTSLYDFYPRNALNKGVRQLTRFGFSQTAQEHLAFRRLDYLNSYELWLSCIRFNDLNQVGSVERGPGISALGRVRFKLNQKEVDSSQERAVETKAMESRSRRLKAVEAVPPYKRVRQSQWLPDVSASDFLAPVLEENVLLKAAFVVALLSLLVWLIISIS